MLLGLMSLAATSCVDGGGRPLDGIENNLRTLETLKKEAATNRSYAKGYPIEFAELPTGRTSWWPKPVNREAYHLRAIGERCEAVLTVPIDGLEAGTIISLKEVPLEGLRFSEPISVPASGH